MSCRNTHKCTTDRKQRNLGSIGSRPTPMGWYWDWAHFTSLIMWCINALLSVSLCLAGWCLCSCLVSCVSVGNISQPNSRGHFSLTDLHCGYFWRDTLRFIPRSEHRQGPGGARCAHWALLTVAQINYLICNRQPDHTYITIMSSYSNSKYNFCLRHLNLSDRF